MPKSPRGEKRPGDVIGAAIMLAKIATGEDAPKPADKTYRSRRGTQPNRSDILRGASEADGVGC
jgi:hypothetical protein